MKKNYYIPDENDMLQMGAALARVCCVGDVIFLEGELGAGKTTLTRGFLRELGYTGVVKSPTYTLVETYDTAEFMVHHFDLYRLNHPEELLEMGLRDYFTENALCIFEWPEKAQAILPEATLCCRIKIPREGNGRLLELLANKEAGMKRLQQIEQTM